MANLTLYSAFDFGAEQGYGNWLVSDSTSSNITISSGALKQTFTGAFTYPTEFTFAGTVNVSSYFQNNAEVYRITGLSLDLMTLATTVLQGQSKASYASLLGGNDNITGSSGSDTLIGFGGNDKIDGGAGVDTVVYSGALADYKIQWTAAGFGVTSLKSNEGADTLINVENVVFSDKTVTPIDPDGAGGKAFRLYQAAFDRAPDQAGIVYWSGQVSGGVTLDAVADAFVKSDEFQKKYAPGLSSNDLVGQWYQNILHRAPDKAGLDFWAGTLDSHAATQAQVLAAISESHENYQQSLTLIGNGYLVHDPIIYT
jgi:Ca2+-binding RTX toxin-like protein